MSWNQPNIKPEYTFINVIGYDHNPITLDMIKESKIPLSDISYDEVTTKLYPGHNYFIGKLFHQSKYWWEEVKTYKSEYTGTMYIDPLFGSVHDPIVIHFLLLYGMSIITRYMPDIWYEINTGKYNHLGALLEYYLTTFENVVPIRILQKITGRTLYTAQPGTGNSLI
jgi:hypothetical protein